LDLIESKKAKPDCSGNRPEDTSHGDLDVPSNALKLMDQD
jgi:hypothetical protein